MSQTAHDAPGSAARLRLSTDTDTLPIAAVQDQCDALADLFMTGGGMAPPGRASVTPLASSPSTPTPFGKPSPHHSAVIAAGLAHAPIEAIVLGHLPVLASAWAPQYARGLAAALSLPVALLRFRAGSVSVEVHGAPEHDPIDAEPDLASGMVRAARLAARWLVSVDAISEPLLADLLRSNAIGSLTLLTGADEAASVACYRTIKSLLGAERETEAQPVLVRIAVMGAGEAPARQAGDRLARAVETFLGFRPEVIVSGDRIEPAPTACFFRGASDAALADALDIIRRTPRAELASPAPAERVPAAFPELGTSEMPSTHVRVAEPVSVPHLAALLRDLRAVELRCPHAREIEFAACPDGKLHALAWDGGDSAPPIAALAAAGAWALLNADLIGTACPGIALRDGDGPVQHVFTRDARRVRGLLDTPVRIHLVMPSAGHAGAALVAGELN